jgi:hypothetical protein
MPFADDVRGIDLFCDALLAQEGRKRLVQQSGIRPTRKRSACAPQKLTIDRRAQLCAAHTAIIPLVGGVSRLRDTG